MSDEPALDRVITGVPLWLMAKYLTDLGASEREPGALEGDGWSVRLDQAEDYQIGSLRVGQVRARFWGEPQVVATILQAFERLLMRGGG